MKNILKFENFIIENYEEKDSSKESMIDDILDNQDVYDRADLESMNIDQLTNIYNDIKNEPVEKEIPEPINQLEYESTKWIQDAIKRPGSLRSKLHKKKGEKISNLEIDSELQALRYKDRNKGKKGIQLSDRDRRKYKQLILAKNLRKFKNK